MSTKEETWARLSGEAWLADQSIMRRLAAAGASAQPLSGGAYSTICDEYRILVARMPSGETPEQIIEHFADSPNDAVGHGSFNTINVFSRRTRGQPPSIGDIYDINLIGPDNGAVMTVQQSPGFGTATSRPETYFVVQAIETPENGTLPEYGAREFGFEYIDGKPAFYTRGVSRARDILVATFGKLPQQRSWIAAMTGLRDRVLRGGGQIAGEVERAYKVTPN